MINHFADVGKMIACREKPMLAELKKLCDELLDGSIAVCDYH